MTMLFFLKPYFRPRLVEKWPLPPKTRKRKRIYEPVKDAPDIRVSEVHFKHWATEMYQKAETRLRREDDENILILQMMVDGTL